MQRIRVIGNQGSGKSTFTLALGKKLDMEPIHLDNIWHVHKGVTIDRQEFANKPQYLVRKESWLIDGNYTKTLLIRLQRADAAIFLDIPRYICLYRAVKR